MTDRLLAGSRERRPIAAVVVLALVLAGTLIPIAYLVSVSLMSRADVGAGLLVPAHPQPQNWVNALSGGLLQSVFNSLIAALAGAALTLVIAVPAAWAITRYRAGGRTLAATVLSPWLLPPIVAVIPLFTLLRSLSLNNTLPGLTLVYALSNVAVAVWLLEGFTRRIPAELDEAAQLDGAGGFRVLLSIVTPLLAPALVAVGIIVAVLNYNEFLLAAFLTQSPDAQTLPVVLTLMLGERITDYGKLAAASVIGLIPVFAAAAFFQRRLVSGLTAGSTR